MRIKTFFLLFLFSFLVVGFVFGLSNIENYQKDTKFLISDSIDVLHYDINLDIVYLSKKEIKGYTELQITPILSNISHISLDLLELTIDSVLINNNLITSYSYNDTLLGISLTSAINPNDTIFARVYYHGQPVVESYGWGGFHFKNDSSLAYNLGVAFVANPHNYGRVWYPCIDDFVDRASYDFHIKVKNDKIAVCSGMLQSEINNGDGTKSFHWKLEETIPTYLSSVAISNYSAVVDTFQGINGAIPTFLHVPQSDTANARLSLINLNSILSVYENRFGPYRWPRVGYVSTVKGAMEHATNIAIPSYMFNGNLNYEWLFAHELSHHWFGDLITCATAEDMWINEGWAVFCESIFMEGIYGEQAYKNYARDNHEMVLQKAHTLQGDGSYLAVYGIPHQYTYGTTVYDKGASMVHTLRGYLGDSLFFVTVKAYLNHFAFDDVSTIQMRDFITNFTGINMNDWFDAWILRPGFSHFSIDSFSVIASSIPEYTATVYVKQKLKGTTILANSNRIEVCFMDDNWNKYKDIIQFSGQTGNQSFVVPFQPTIVMLDIDEKTLDATTDQYKIVNSTGVLDFESTNFMIDVQQITDSAFVRVEHNWVAPDPHKIPINGLILSDYRYWKIDGIFPAGFNAKGKFLYSKFNYLDNVLLANPKDSLIILYRQNAGDEWQPISFVKSGTNNHGYLIVDNLRRGEYSLAIWDEAHLGINNNYQKDEEFLTIYPNPSNDYFVFNFNIKNKSTIEIFNSIGELVDNIEIDPDSYRDGQNEINWQPINLPNGNYFVNLKLDDKLVITKKIIYLK